MAVGNAVTFAGAAAAALAVAAFVSYSRKPLETGAKRPRDEDEEAGPGCGFEHVGPFQGDPLAVKEAIYVQHVKPGAYKASMGLSALDMSTFIELGSRYPELIAERRRVIETNPTDVTFMLECAREASLEYLHYIADYITQRFPTCFEKINGGKGILNKVTGESWPDLDAVPEPMKVVGSLIIEDVAILTKHKTDAHPDDDVNWKYNSSINCYSFPGSLMTTKIGTVMGVVHEPVPGFNAKILKPVNKWFDVLQNPSHRLNWFIQKDPRYFRPEYVGNMVDMNEPERPPTFEELYLRVERQTFIRLPKTKAVVFGIRLFVYKLTDVIADMEEREKTEVPKGNPDDPDPDKRPLRPFVERLYSAVCRMGPDFSKYKNMVALNPIVKQWLEDHKGMSEKYIEAS